MEHLFADINKLKKQKDVTILAHYYMPAELQLLEKDGGIADFIGDSLGLSLEAQQASTKNILFCGVKFMAETALIVNASCNVFMPDPTAGCSLASSITANDIRNLKKKYPGVPVMGYINTYAETKTELDICCTSRNALKIIESLESDQIIFVPDLYMGQNLQWQVKEKFGKELILWNGTCEVHEQFNNSLLDMDKDSEILLHWEVPHNTVYNQLEKRKGIVGSTGDIINYVKSSKSKKFILASECDLATTLKQQNSDKEFITPCFKCSYMKQNSLNKIVLALKAIGSSNQNNYRVELSDAIIKKAQIPVNRMLAFN